jgi:hypothetical protein
MHIARLFQRTQLNGCLSTLSEMLRYSINFQNCDPLRSKGPVPSRSAISLIRNPLAHVPGVLGHWRLN